MVYLGDVRFNFSVMEGDMPKQISFFVIFSIQKKEKPDEIASLRYKLHIFKFMAYITCILGINRAPKIILLLMMTAPSLAGSSHGTKQGPPSYDVL